MELKLVRKRKFKYTKSVKLAGACGMVTSGLVFAGNPPEPGIPTDSESWDGSAWTEGGTL